ncbi:MAG: hypothetical protein V1778_02930 [bacterium]
MLRLLRQRNSCGLGLDGLRRTQFPGSFIDHFFDVELNGAPLQESSPIGALSPHVALQIFPRRLNAKNGSPA